MNQPHTGIAEQINGTLQKTQALFVIPKKLQIFSGSALKVIAVISMLIDHIGFIFLKPDAFVLLSVFGKQITLYWVMRFIGRMAFPIFAFLLVEGVRYTRNRFRYGLNLCIFALLSEVPWDLLFYGKWFTFQKQNVFFTLLLGYIAICLYEKFKGRFVLQAGVLAGLFAVAVVLRADYSYAGYVFILLVYALQNHRLIQALVAASGLLPFGIKPVIAYVPLMLYNGKRGFIHGKVLKYAFYAFYPLHMLALFLIRMYLG